MYFVYLIKSERYNQFYLGHTSDIERRIKEHNSGKTKSIRKDIPYKLIYFESFETREEAIKRERYLKSGTGREYLRKIKYSR